MSVQLLSSLCCESVFPAPGAKLNYYGVFAELKAESFPLMVPRFSLVTSWSGGEGFHIQVVKMLSPSKSVVLHQSPEMYFTLESETQVAFVHVDFQQIIFAEPGVYELEIYLDSKKVSFYSLKVC